MKTFFDIYFTTLLKIFFGILSVLPKKQGIWFCDRLTNLILQFFPRSKYVTFRNLSLCFPEMEKNKKEIIWKGLHHTLALNILGFAKGPSVTKEQAIKDLDISQCAELLDEIKDNKNKGHLLLIPHFGSFELLAQYWCLYDKPFAILARGFGMKRLDHFWNSKRQANGVTLFSRKGGFKKIIQFIEEGTNVAILFDQNVKRSHSTFVDFFGIPASTTKTIGLTSQKTNCKIFFAIMIPLANGKYRLIAHKIKSPVEREGTHEQKIHNTILESHKYLEYYIRAYPEQWFWLHRRFKTRPLGEKENFYDKKLYPEDL